MVYRVTVPRITGIGLRPCHALDCFCVCYLFLLTKARRHAESSCEEEMNNVQESSLQTSAAKKRCYPPKLLRILGFPVSPQFYLPSWISS